MAEKLDCRPEEFGLIKLPLPVPPTLESALGYPGDERYVAFHECRVTSAGFFIEDATHKWPGVEAAWSLFNKHPAVSRVLQAINLDLKRTLPIMSWEQWMALSPSQREDYWSKTRYLVLDRQERLLYGSISPRVTLFLITSAMISGEPGMDDEDEEIDDEEVEPLLETSEHGEDEIPDAEAELAAAVPIEIGREVVQDLRAWLDAHEPLERDYTPGPTESCGFRITNITVGPGQIEDAFGYRGGKRYISLHWSPKAHQVFVCDGIGRWSLSGAVDTWTQFLNDPLIQPHLQAWDESEKPARSVPIDFSAKIDKLPESPLFASEDSARAMEADVQTNCLLYDRASNQIYTGSWASAILFHSLVEDMLEEDLVSAPGSAAVPLLTWLNRRREDPKHVFVAAAAHHDHHQEHSALEMLRRCIELEPASHLYWFRLSQTFGSLSQWEDALQACEKAIAFHASALRQYVSAGQMLKSKAKCLFMLQRYAEASDAYRFAIEIDDFAHKAESYSQLGRCYEKLGSYGQAIRARELQVRDRADSLAKAQRCRESGEVDDEIVDTERFFLGEAWLDLGRCNVLDGNLEAAEWALRQAVDVSGKLRDPHIKASNCIKARAELGALLRRIGRSEDAGRELQGAITMAIAKVEENPTLGSAHSDLAFVYSAMGNSEAAEQAEQRAAELGWKSGEEERRVVSMGALNQHQ